MRKKKIDFLDKNNIKNIYCIKTMYKYNRRVWIESIIFNRYWRVTFHYWKNLEWYENRTDLKKHVELK